MHARSTRPSSRARLAAFTAAAVLTVGTALLGTTSPALAATTPTLSGPASTTGYGPVTMTGTAAPGARVTLIEAAYIFRGDMNPAQDFANGDIITTVADGSGRFTLRRTMDSGFVFAAEADGLRSNVITIEMVAKPSLQLTVSGGNVNVDVHADPSQPWLPVAVQRQNGTAWTTLVEGFTGETGVYSTVLTGQPTGTQHYRAEVGPDAANAVTLGRTAVVAVAVGGTGTGTPVTPTPTTPTTPPTTPTPKPTTPPVTAGPKAGDVLFTLVQYDPVGKDSNTAKSLNSEYWRITNKTKKTINMQYWTVKDRAGNTYRFPTFYLLAGRSVTIATGKGTNGKPVAWRYWGRTGHVLNNTGDGLYLRTGSGKTIDTCGWTNGSGRTGC
jgi:hypothetical protein